MIAIRAITAISNVVDPPGISSQKDGREGGGCSVTVTVGVTIVVPFVVAAAVICTVMST